MDKIVYFSQIKNNPFHMGIYNIWQEIDLFTTLKPFLPRKHPNKIKDYIKSPLYTCKQTHSSIINNTKQISDGCQGDGIILNNETGYVGIVTADCTPVVLYSKQENKLIAIHCGWRGVYKGIVEKALNMFDKSPEVFIGVAISQENYEVGKEFIYNFSAYPSCIQRNQEKYFLDIRCIIKKQLENNVKKTYIDNRCSYKEKELFFSYRREKEYSGRNMLIAGFK